MLIAHDGGCVVVRLAGRLDGESAEQLADTLDRLLREGQRNVLLDLEDVTYLSSPGTQVLNRAYQEFSSLRGELKVGPASAPALEALSLADLKSRLVVDANPAETLTRMRASSSALRALELTRDAWRSPVSAPLRGLYEVTGRDPAGALVCRVYAGEIPAEQRMKAPRPRIVEFPDTAFGLGVGALGAAPVDWAVRLGELVAAAGAAVYLPTEGSQVPDFDLGLGGRAPSAVLASGLICEGAFSQLVRFSTQPDADAVPLAELARVCLDAVGGDTVGLVALAESAGLVGAWLRRSPAGTLPGIAFDVEGVREWLGTTPEPVHEGTTALVVGVASRAPDPALAPQLRPLGDGSGILGHFHAVVFTYRPVPQRTMALRVLVTKLFIQQRVRALLHLLSDDRGGAGAGESQFQRGLCWAAPVTRVITAA